MARLALPLLLLATLLVASCAGFQKRLDPLSERLDSLRLSQMGIENRLAAVEARLAELDARQQSFAGRLEGASAPRSASVVRRPPAPEPAGAPAAAAAPAPAAPRDNPEALYEAALRLLRQERKAREAKILFERFLKLYPQHRLTPNAMYWSGECLYDLREYVGAVVAFKEVPAAYPKHRKAAAALLKMGYCYLCLQDEANARDYLGRVGRLYPGSEEARAARAALERIAKRAYAGKKEEES
jgi:tol-pal system protein YbgF